MANLSDLPNLALLPKVLRRKFNIDEFDYVDDIETAVVLECTLQDEKAVAKVIKDMSQLSGIGKHKCAVPNRIIIYCTYEVQDVLYAFLIARGGTGFVWGEGK